MNLENNDIAEALWSAHEIDISKYDPTFLHSALVKRSINMNFKTTNSYSQFTKQNKAEALYFESVLHNNYSEFFRNPLTFSVIEQIVLPLLALQKKEIRIWCTACAAGQEAYSLAILMEELKRKMAKDLKYAIYATDQCSVQIDKAIQGHYEASAVSKVSIKRGNDWFVKHGDTYTIDSALRKNIAFSTFDLFDKKLSVPSASIFGSFDLVFCANLLFYYKPEFRMKILSKVRKSLVNQGFLVTGETEREILANADFCEVFPSSALFQIKEKHN